MIDFDISLFMLNMWINIVSGTIIKNTQLVVCIQLVVHMFYYRFNVFKLRLFNLFMYVDVFRHMFHCVVKLF